MFTELYINNMQDCVDSLQEFSDKHSLRWIVDERCVGEILEELNASQDHQIEVGDPGRKVILDWGHIRGILMDEDVVYDVKLEPHCTLGLNRPGVFFIWELNARIYFNFNCSLYNEARTRLNIDFYLPVSNRWRRAIKILQTTFKKFFLCYISF